MGIVVCLEGAGAEVVVNLWDYATRPYLCVSFRTHKSLPRAESTFKDSRKVTKVHTTTVAFTDRPNVGNRCMESRMLR